MAAVDHCIVLIPSHHAAGTIGSVVTDARAFLPRVLVVDDASPDATAEVARAAGAEVLPQTSPQGRGAALRAGLVAAQAADAEWALVLSADGRYDAADIPTLLATAERTNADLVIGVRPAQTHGRPWLHRFASRWASFDFARWSGLPLVDLHSGFRLIRIAAWRQARPTAEGWLIDPDMVVAFLAAGLRVVECPVRLNPIPAGSLAWLSWEQLHSWWKWRQLARARLTLGRS